MNLKSTSIFLFVASILVILSNLLQHGLMFFNDPYGIGFSFSLQGEIYSIIWLMYGIVFLLLGISFMRRQYNPDMRKVIGIYLIVIISVRIVANSYSNYVWYTDEHYYTEIGESVFWKNLIISILHILFLIPLLITGAALAGGNRKRVRSSMIAAMIGLGGTLSLTIYRIIYSYAEGGGYFSRSKFGEIWFWYDVINLMELALPVAQFLWAIAVYQRLGKQLDKSLSESEVLDEL